MLGMLVLAFSPRLPVSPFQKKKKKNRFDLET